MKQDYYKGTKQVWKTSIIPGENKRTSNIVSSKYAS